MANNRPMECSLTPAALGSVTPAGWLRRQFIIQKEGLSGHIDTLWEDLGETSGWLGGSGENWERGPYYLDGLVALAWSIGDEALQLKARRWIEWMLSSQQEDGFFGPADNLDWWPRIVALKALTQYHEASGDGRVLTLMDRYFRFQLRSLPRQPLAMWAAARGQEQLLPMLYLRRATGADYLPELADLLHEQTDPWGRIFTDFPYTRPTHAYLNRPLFMLVKRWTLISDWTARRLRRVVRPKPRTGARIKKANASAPVRVFHQTHSVNLAMALKMPALDALWGGDTQGAAASMAGVQALERYHGLANGLFSGDEHLNGRSPAVGAELCLAAEYMYSLETLLAVTGDARYADLLEETAYGAWPAMFTADMCAHQYVQQVNQVEVSRRRRDWYDAYQEANLYGLKPNFGCCAANMHQGWPKLLGSLLMRHPAGIAAAVYAPCAAVLSVRGTQVRLTEQTGYPFDESVTFCFDSIACAAQALAFTLFLRLPGWAERWTLRVNGAAAEAVPRAGWLELTRTFCAGDRVELRLPMPLRINREAAGGVTIRRGPLLLALPIAAKRRVVRGKAPFTDVEMFPASPWRYAAVESALARAEVIVREPGEFPFGEDAPPLIVRLFMAPVVNWPMVRHSAGPIPKPQVVESGALEEKTLVPYGCTRLRIAQFPIAAIKEETLCR